MWQAFYLQFSMGVDTILFFFFLIYLKVRAWTICWFTSEMVIMTRAGPGWIIWVCVGAGDQALGLSSAAFSGRLAGSWIGSGGVGTWVGVHMGFCHHRHHRQQFNLYHGANHNIIVQQSSPTLCGIYQAWFREILGCFLITYPGILSQCYKFIWPALWHSKCLWCWHSIGGHLFES